MDAGLTRRELLVRAGGIAGLSLVVPIAGRAGPAFGRAPVDPAAAARNRLVVLFLEGGNDGLNTVIPTADVPGAPRRSVYRKVRPTIAYGDALALDRAADASHGLGLNPKLPVLHRLYRDGQVAIVQGVDYPNHSYSHFASTDIWHSGDPGRSPDSGWLGRHLDRSGIGEGELRAVAIGNEVPLMLRGTSGTGAAITSIAATRFADAAAPDAGARHRALRGYAAFPPSDPVRLAVGRRAAEAAGVVETLGSAPSPPSTGSAVLDAMLTARVLLEEQLGVECVYVSHGSFDTHAAQVPAHERLLSDLDAALEAFWFGTNRGTRIARIGPLPPALASRTVVMLVSEFGRRIGENGGAGAAGTDHGAAAPVILIGPPGSAATALVPGLHGDHPPMGTVALPADNLAQTTELRQVYEAVLTHWLGDPDPLYASTGALSGLFTVAQRPAAPQRPVTVAVTSSVREQAAPALDLPPATAPAGPSSPEAAGPRQRITVGRPARPSLHPASVASAIAFNVAAAALAVRAGGVARLRALLGGDGDPPAES